MDIRVSDYISSKFTEIRQRVPVKLNGFFDADSENVRTVSFEEQLKADQSQKSDTSSALPTSSQTSSTTSQTSSASSASSAYSTEAERSTSANADANLLLSGGGSDILKSGGVASAVRTVIFPNITPWEPKVESEKELTSAADTEVIDTVDGISDDDEGGSGTNGSYPNDEEDGERQLVEFPVIEDAQWDDGYNTGISAAEREDVGQDTGLSAAEWDNAEEYDLDLGSELVGFTDPAFALSSGETSNLEQNIAYLNRYGDEEVRQMVEDAIVKSADRYGIDENLIRAVITQESGFSPTSLSSAGAQGLMQLMPDTAEHLGIDNPWDISQNVDGGTKLLRDYLVNYSGDLQLALSAYNAGPGAVERYQGVPPYTETEQYVKNVMGYYNQYSGGAGIISESMSGGYGHEDEQE